MGGADHPEHSRKPRDRAKRTTGVMAWPQGIDARTRDRCRGCEDRARRRSHGRHPEPHERRRARQARARELALQARSQTKKNSLVARLFVLFVFLR